MLKAIIEDGDGGAEHAVGVGLGNGADVGDQNHGPRHGARQHQRLIPAAVEIRGAMDAVAHDDHAVFLDAPAVAAAENRGPLACGEQHARDVRDKRRLAAPTHRQIADTDDRGRV